LTVPAFSPADLAPVLAGGPARWLAAAMARWRTASGLRAACRGRGVGRLCAGTARWCPTGWRRRWRCRAARPRRRRAGPRRGRPGTGWAASPGVAIVLVGVPELRDALVGCRRAGVESGGLLADLPLVAAQLPASWPGRSRSPARTSQVQ